MTGQRGNPAHVLDDAECLELLAAAEIGRVGVTIDALPAIFPVAYRVVDGQVMFFTGEGTKLTAAVSGAVVAFEADWADTGRRAGWSVQMVGIARVDTDAADHRAVDLADLHPWAAGGRLHLIAIRPERISGRRLPGIPAVDGS